MPAGFLFRGVGLEPLRLESKEGLALINGTHFMAAAGSLLLSDLGRVRSAALAAAAMSIDACRATDAFLDPRLHAARGQPGQQRPGLNTLQTGRLRGRQHGRHLCGHGRQCRWRPAPGALVSQGKAK